MKISRRAHHDTKIKQEAATDTIKDGTRVIKEHQSEQEIHDIKESDQNIEVREIATIREEHSFDANENKT